MDRGLYSFLDFVDNDAFGTTEQLESITIRANHYKSDHPDVLEEGREVFKLICRELFILFMRPNPNDSVTGGLIIMLCDVVKIIFTFSHAAEYKVEGTKQALYHTFIEFFQTMVNNTIKDFGLSNSICCIRKQMRKDVAMEKKERRKHVASLDRWDDVDPDDDDEKALEEYFYNTSIVGK